MIETNIKDRIPTYPGRVKLSPVAGQTNVYDMSRADAPIEEGTPINKATLDSFITSRLTGRYYIPNVEYSSGNSRTNLTVSPIPSSGWVYDASNANRATSGVYTVEVDSNNGSAWQAHNAFNSSGWQNMGGNEADLIVSHPAVKIMVKAVRCRIEAQYTSRFTELIIQGSNNGIDWDNLHLLNNLTFGSDVTYNLTTTGDYSYYKLVVKSSDSNRITVKDFRYILYDINIYSNKYTIETGVPATYDVEQRLLIKTPSNVNTFAVTSNTLNGIAVDTVLQPSTRYELVYNGTSFTAKGV